MAYGSSTMKKKLHAIREIQRQYEQETPLRDDWYAGCYSCPHGVETCADCIGTCAHNCEECMLNDMARRAEDATYT